MKKKVAKVVLATALCVSMMGTTCFAAEPLDLTSHGSSGTVEGDNEVTETVFKITVPTKMEFALDPFEQGGVTGENLDVEDFVITNKSNVPVKLDVNLTLAGKAGVEIVGTAAEVTNTDDSKLIYMEAKVAKTVTETAAAGTTYKFNGADVAGAFKSTDVSFPNTYYATNAIAQTVEGAAMVPSYADTTNEMKDVASTTVVYDAGDLVSYKLSENKTRLTFALDAASYITWYENAETSHQLYKQTAATNKGSAAFSFTGKVNSEAVWKPGDVHAKMVYTLKGMSPAAYGAVSFEPNAQGLDEAVMDTAPTFASTVKGKIAVTDVGTGDATFSEFSKIEMTSSNGTFDGFNAFSTIWEAADYDVPTKTATLPAAFMSYFTADTEARITYKTTTGETRIATVLVKCTN